MLLSSSDTIRVTLMHLFVFTNTAQRELFQYVRREYATANKFPCIITLEPGIRKRWNPFTIVYKMSVLQFLGCIKTKLALRFFFEFSIPIHNSLYSGSYKVTHRDDCTEFINYVSFCSGFPVIINFFLSFPNY